MEKTVLLTIHNSFNEAGLLDDISEDKKEKLSIKLIETQKFLIERNENDDVETLIFPLVARAFRKNENFDAVSLVKEFIDDYKKVDLLAEYLVSWIDNKFKK